MSVHFSPGLINYRFGFNHSRSFYQTVMNKAGQGSNLNNLSRARRKHQGSEGQQKGGRNNITWNEGIALLEE